MKTTTPSPRRGRKTDNFGFSNVLLTVFWPAYSAALLDWKTETGKDPGEHFTVYDKGRALEIMRAAASPENIPNNAGFLDALARCPDFVAFVLRRFIRLRETGDAKGKPGSICRRGILLMLASANPDLSPADVAELAKKSVYAKHPEIRSVTGNDVSAALLKPRRANLARLREIAAASNYDANAV